MALIKFGGGVSAISGKIGGTVYARNRGGAYARNWAKPTNTPTTKQSSNRLAFGNVSKAWAALTVLQQENWNTLASTVTRMNRLGDLYTPTGRQIFLESANNLRVVGFDPLTDAPPSLLQPTIDGFPVFAPTVDAGAVDSFGVSGLAAQAGISYVLESTKMFGQQKGNFSLDYRVLRVAVTAATIAALADYIAAYGDIAAVGDTVSIRLRYIDTANGMASPPLVMTAQTVAP